MKVTATENIKMSTVRYPYNFPVTSYRASAPMQKPDTFVKSSYAQAPSVDERSKSAEYTSTVSDLKLIHSKAQHALSEQKASDGWNGKFADAISVIWGSKNRSKVVLADLDEYKADTERLDKAIKSGTFETRFKEIFGLPYNSESVQSFKEASEEYSTAVKAEYMAELTEEALRSRVDFFIENRDSINPESPNFDPYKKHPPIKEHLEAFKADLCKFTGGEEMLEKLALSKRRDFRCASREEQIEVYSEIAEYLMYTARATADRCKHGKTDKQIQKDYDDAYEKAFGTKNNIQKRVDKYIRVQQIRSAVVKDLAVAGMIATTVATSGTALPILVGSAVTLGGYIGLDIAENLTNDVDNSEDLSGDSVKEIIKNAAICSAEYMVGAGLHKFVPGLKTGKKALDITFDIAKTAGIELSTAFVAEYARTGEWATDQINPKAFIALIAATYITEDVLTTVMSAPGGIKAAAKQSPVYADTAKRITKKSRAELQKQFMKNPQQFMNLKLLEMADSEVFDDFILTLTEEYAKNVLQK